MSQFRDEFRVIKREGVNFEQLKSCLILWTPNDRPFPSFLCMPLAVSNQVLAHNLSRYGNVQKIKLISIRQQSRDYRMSMSSVKKITSVKIYDDFNAISDYNAFMEKGNLFRASISLKTLNAVVEWIIGRRVHQTCFQMRVLCDHATNPQETPKLYRNSVFVRLISSITSLRFCFIFLFFLCY